MNCQYCNGRAVKTDTGYRCLSSACQGAKGFSGGGESVMCSCGEAMEYRGLNTYGEPNYQCPECGKTKKL